MTFFREAAVSLQHNKQYQLMWFKSHKSTQLPSIVLAFVKLIPIDSINLKVVGAFSGGH